VRATAKDYILRMFAAPGNENLLPADAIDWMWSNKSTIPDQRDDGLIIIVTVSTSLLRPALYVGLCVKLSTALSKFGPGVYITVAPVILPRVPSIGAETTKNVSHL
jgi:hypothetical protein